jgi:hypothetical protein
MNNAEVEGIEQLAAADLAVVGEGGCLATGGASAARLGALIKEEHPCAVDDVDLNAGDVDDVLHLGARHGTRATVSAAERERVE